MAKNTNLERRFRRKVRIRARVSGTAERPRLSVFRSNLVMYVQLVDDEKGTTLCSAKETGTTVAKAKVLGIAIAAIAKKKGITKLVFDRNGYRYHGAIKALADSVREGGITV
ncbi:MAG TPA: 50S ribosomal protein L18 [Patescibacteria group bacterium]|jgi:large subunit ribosomal protein L18|nr:50S ribosomal protein L18 [Patescibacteria group bacterium]